MARRIPSALTYPITMRQVENYLVISVKDFNITVAVEMPDGRFHGGLWKDINLAIGRCWVKTKETIDARVRTNIPLPDPSKIAVATEKEKKVGRQIKPLTAPEVARILGRSESSIRRIPKSLLRFRTTKGGHRRYALGAVVAYQEMFDWSTAGDIPASKDSIKRPPETSQ